MSVLRILRFLAFLLVPLGLSVVLTVGLVLVADSVNPFPSFAGFGQYLKMMLEPDIFPMFVRNLMPLLFDAGACSFILFCLYGAVRRVLKRVPFVLIYITVFVASYISVFNKQYIFDAFSGIGDLTSYPAGTIVTNPQQYRDGMTVSYLLISLFAVAIGVFVSYCLFCALIRFKVASKLKLQRNTELGLVCAIVTMCSFVLLNLFENRIWNVARLVKEGAPFVALLRYVVNCILSSDWMLFAALCLAVIAFVKLRRGKILNRGIIIAMLVFACLSLLYSLLLRNSAVALKTYVDVFGSCVLIAVATGLLCGRVDLCDGVKLIRAASWTAAAVGFVTLLSILIKAALFSIRIMNMGGSIAIIGGADGPTAQFITHMIFGQSEYRIIVSFVLLVVGIVWGIIAINNKKTKTEAN